MLLKLDGETLVRRAVRVALAAKIAPVVVGFENNLVRRELEGLDYDTTTNPDYTGPTSSSLHMGLDLADANQHRALGRLMCPQIGSPRQEPQVRSSRSLKRTEIKQWHHGQNVVEDVGLDRFVPGPGLVCTEDVDLDGEAEFRGG
jgi:hypothetical protein